MRYGYGCEDCNLVIYPTTTRAELTWLKDRAHVVREVARHSSDGLDGWMMEGLTFLDDHADHSIVMVTRRP